MFDDSDEVIKTERTAARATDGEERKKTHRSRGDSAMVENVTHACTHTQTRRRAKTKPRK